MRVLKLTSMVLILTLSLGGAAMATGGKGQQEKQAPKMEQSDSLAENKDLPEMFLEVLKERLDLTDEQKEKLFPILKDQKEKELEMFKAYKEQVLQDRKNLETQLSKILDEKQMKVFQEMDKPNFEKRPGMQPGFMGQVGPMHHMHGHQRMQPGAMKPQAQMPGQPGMQPGFMGQSHPMPGQPGMQPGGMEGKFPKGEGLLDTALKELKLSDEQKEQLTSIVKKYRDSNKDAFEKTVKAQNDMMKQLFTAEEFDETKVREASQQIAFEKANMKEQAFISQAKMLEDIKDVLDADQKELLKEKGDALFIGFQDRIHERHSIFDF